MKLINNEQYRLYVYHLKTLRFMYEATRSRCYLAEYHKSFARLFDARLSGDFLVFELSQSRPSVISFTRPMGVIEDNTTTVKLAS